MDEKSAAGLSAVGFSFLRHRLRGVGYLWGEAWKELSVAIVDANCQDILVLPVSSESMQLG